MGIRAIVKIVAAASVGLGAFAVLAQQPPAGPPAGPKAGFPDLASGLKATPGCLGVEMAQTASGKNVIFAWFEDKRAVMRWYGSEAHQQAMDMFFPDQDAEHAHRVPLEGISDDFGPIMAIASLTMADRSGFKDTTLPVSQIAIELYAPVAGGLFLGSRFAPAGVKVADMADYAPK